MRAPRRYRIRSVEPEATQEEPLTVALRSVRMETDPLTGEDREVAFFPNPVTGKVEREDAPGWRPPAGVGRLPAG